MQRRYQHYSHDQPDPNNHLEWLALMQHHFAPTRMLDWTYSFYVALFFAAENASEDFETRAGWAENAHAPAGPGSRGN